MSRGRDRSKPSKSNCSSRRSPRQPSRKARKIKRMTKRRRKKRLLSNSQIPFKRIKTDRSRRETRRLPRKRLSPRCRAA